MLFLVKVLSLSYQRLWLVTNVQYQPIRHKVISLCSYSPRKFSWAVIWLFLRSRPWLWSWCSIEGSPMCWRRVEGGTWAASVGSRLRIFLCQCVSNRINSLRPSYSQGSLFMHRTSCFHQLSCFHLSRCLHVGRVCWQCPICTVQPSWELGRDHHCL